MYISFMYIMEDYLDYIHDMKLPMYHEDSSVGYIEIPGQRRFSS